MTNLRIDDDFMNVWKNTQLNKICILGSAFLDAIIIFLFSTFGSNWQVCEGETHSQIYAISRP